MNRRILVDINVLLDVLARRTPHDVASSAIWSVVECRQLEGFVSTASVTTLYYLLRKLADHGTALRGVRLVTEVFALVPVDAELIDKALNSSFNDFEDAVQHETALRINATSLVTRDARHFRKSVIPPITPEAFIAGLGA